MSYSWHIDTIYLCISFIFAVLRVKLRGSAVKKELTAENRGVFTQRNAEKSRINNSRYENNRNGDVDVAAGFSGQAADGTRQILGSIHR
jgi:hypothetical protein